MEAAPDKPPRFQLVSPFKGCSIWPEPASASLTATARDTSMGRYGEGTTFFACVMPDQRGWSLRVHTTFTKASGAFSATTLGATLARTVVGDSSGSRQLRDRRICLGLPKSPRN